MGDDHGIMDACIGRKPSIGPFCKLRFGGIKELRILLNPVHHFSENGDNRGIR